MHPCHPRVWYLAFDNTSHRLTIIMMSIRAKIEENPESYWETPEAFFQSMSGLYFRPMGYTITLGMFLTRWVWREDGRWQGRIIIRFDGCKSINTRWGTRFGPYQIKAGQSNGMLKVESLDQQFGVVCKSAHFQSQESIHAFQKNVSQASWKYV